MPRQWINPSPNRVRYIRLRRLRNGEKVWLGASVNAGCGCDDEKESWERTTEDHELEAIEPGALLLKEVEETSKWARLGLQLYFGWFALQFTVNGFAVGWLFTYKGSMPWFASLVFLAFTIWNLMGTIVTVLLYKCLVESDLRIKQVIEAMVKPYVTEEDSWLRPTSPMPRRAIGIMFAFCVVTMFISLAFWIILFVAGR